jgi:hypothetical protein
MCGEEHERKNGVAKQKIPDERAAGRESRLGRPPLPRDLARSERVVSFVTPAELDALREHADASGMSVSAVVHQILGSSLAEKK